MQLDARRTSSRVVAFCALLGGAAGAVDWEQGGIREILPNAVSQEGGASLSVRRLFIGDPNTPGSFTRVYALGAGLKASVA